MADHEDNGMMAVVQVVKNPSVAEVRTDRVMYMIPPDQASVGSSSLFAGGGSLQAMILYCRKLGLL